MEWLFALSGGEISTILMPGIKLLVPRASLNAISKNSSASESYLFGIMLWTVALATAGPIQFKSMN
jgi:hypothetical protein